MTLSIIIPALNEENYIGDCLRSLLAHASGRALEIIVVDNGSTDATAKIARGFPGVRVVTERQRGLTRARQKGLASARGEIIAYIDADTRMPAGWCEKVLQAFSADPVLVGLSGPYDYIDLPLRDRMVVDFYWKYLAKPTSLMTGYMLVGGNFAARRDALQKIGGFDTSISFYGEDTDIARRLSAVGTVRFMNDLRMPTSARRLQKEGMMKTGAAYVGNYLSEVILHRPITKKYVNVR